MRIFIIILLIFLTQNLVAQNTIAITNFNTSTMFYCPAAAGEEEGINFAAFYKSQWTGINASPSVMAVSISSPLQYSRYGIGMNIIGESSGIQKYYHVNGNFAYKFNYLNGKLSFGVRPGFVQWTASYDKLTIKDEETIPSNNMLLPSIGGGIFFRNEKLKLGISADYTPSIYEGNNVLSKLYFVGLATYKSKLSPSIQWHPSVLIRYTRYFDPYVILSSPFEIKKMIWLGVSYRSLSTTAVMAGLNVNTFLHSMNDQLKLFYTYDITIGEQRNYLGATHEVMLSFVFGTKKSIDALKKERVTVSPLNFD